MQNTEDFLKQYILSKQFKEKEKKQCQLKDNLEAVYNISVFMLSNGKLNFEYLHF